MSAVCSEQSGGFLLLIPLCFLVYGVGLEVPDPEPVEVCTVGFEYTGRDSEGRPTFDYREVCDEY